MCCGLEDVVLKQYRGSCLFPGRTSDACGGRGRRVELRGELKFDRGGCLMFSWVTRLLGVQDDSRGHRVPVPKRLIPESARKVLENAEAMTVYSLDPAGFGEDTPENFHRWRVLGSITIACPDTRARIAASMIAANRASDGGFKCFDPTHGVSITWQGRMVDLLACFWCSQLEVIGPGGDWAGIFPLTGQPQRQLDRLLRRGGVTLAKPPSG